MSIIEASDLAKNGNSNYIETISKINKIHQKAIDELFDNENSEHVHVFLAEKLDQLKDILKSIFILKDLSDKSLAKIVSTGEILSSFIITEAMKINELNAILKDSRSLIKTNSDFIKAEVDLDLTYKNTSDFISSDEHDIIVLPGFISSDKNGEITTLGRGGSDFTAAIYANALNAEVLEIWTDVSGMFTANPKLVKQAKPIKEISYLSTWNVKWITSMWFCLLLRYYSSKYS